MVHVSFFLANHCELRYTSEAPHFAENPNGFFKIKLLASTANIIISWGKQIEVDKKIDCTQTI